MRRILLVWTAATALWIVALILAFQPMDARRAIALHGPAAQVETPAPGGHDFYRPNAAVQRDAVRRQAADIARARVDDARMLLDRFVGLAVLPPVFGLGLAVALGWALSPEARR